LKCGAGLLDSCARLRANVRCVHETTAYWAGRNVLEAFDRLEVIESKAEAIINCGVVGEMAPMPAEVTAELERVFLT
jgi:hypothetical protein